MQNYIKYVAEVIEINVVYCAVKYGIVKQVKIYKVFS